MLISLTLLALAAQSLSDVSAPYPDSWAEVTITEENVELAGAGTLKFDPDINAFPADFLVPGGDNSLTVRQWFDASGKPLSCEAEGREQPHAAQTACKQLMASATFERTPGIASPMRKGFMDIQFVFLAQSPTSSELADIHAVPIPTYRNMVILYPPDVALGAAKLEPGEGEFSIAIQGDHYPARAMRDMLESVSTIQLGVTRDGIISSCRPITGSGLRTAFLDNHSCALFLRLGKFTFHPEAPQYEGARYLNRRMVWRLPE